jgi:hypothetical protein
MVSQGTQVRVGLRGGVRRDVGLDRIGSGVVYGPHGRVMEQMQGMWEGKEEVWIATVGIM